MHRRGLAMRALRFMLGAGLTLAAACKSSGSEPPDPVAVEYCAACSELASCQRVVEGALVGACPDETRAYYVCLTENACDPMSCDAEWEERQNCLVEVCLTCEDAGMDSGIGGTGGSGGIGGSGGTGGTTQ